MTPRHDSAMTHLFQDLGLYSGDHAALYNNLSTASDLAPHIFAVADRCFTALVTSHASQVCVISGESGAGKTEATKQVR